MKSLMWLLKCMLDNTSIRCGTDTHRDYITMSRRIKHEGLSFLTITLPNYGKDFERSLDRGLVTPADFLGFRRKAALPTLLWGLLARVFDPGTGELLDEPDVEAILCIRQLCLMWKKVNLKCSKDRVQKAYDGFYKCEYELNGLMAALPVEVYSLFGKVADVLWSQTLGPLDRKIQDGEHLIPRHGPGATAEKISGNQKYIQKRWHRRLEASFPFSAYGMSNPYGVDVGDPLAGVEFVEPGMEEPVRVVTVPKTLKTPRIIAIEPVCTQYTQQALAHPIMEMIEQAKHTRGHINFRDQTINQQMARMASKSGRLATLDLSEASDRVHKDLVYRMLQAVPYLRDAVFATRSMRASVQGNVISLCKFASMGSALCFPMESMLFYTVLITARLITLNLPPTPHAINFASREVYVYGDDLIVPCDEVLPICFALNSFGLKVNEHKSFWTGRFRESCGMDAYNGIDVTPVYLRNLPPAGRRNASAVISFVAFANQLYTKGWWTAARRVRDEAEALFGPLPHVLESSPCLGWSSFRNEYTYQKLCPDHQKPVVKAMVVKPVYREDVIDGHAALMKYFLNAGEEPVLQKKHLERTVRPRRVRIEVEWAPSC